MRGSVRHDGKCRVRLNPVQVQVLSITTKTRDRLLGLTLVALLATIGGELLGMTLLVTIGVTGFFLALVGLFAIMTVTLVVGVSQTSGSKIYDPTLADRACLSTPPSEH